MNQMRLAIVLSLFAPIFSCCQPDGENSTARVAPKNVEESFYIGGFEREGSSSISHPRIAIHKDSLEKEFLLQGEIISQPVVAQPSNLKSRVVFFEKRNQHLVLLESTIGHSVSSAIPQKFLLAKFPIIKSSEDLFYFDFNEGMSKIFVSADWRAQDLEGPYYNSKGWNSVDLQDSYIDSASMEKDNTLVIKQVSQIKGPLFGVNYMQPVQVNYYLSPYDPNQNFEPTISDADDKTGFFEVAPQLSENSGDTLIYATKFDHKKPIEFSISANTPSEYVEAVRDGILYWNKAFGREVIRAKIAPEGASAPDYRHNIVQWINWDDAGYAYADAQMDPRTGEILHAQVFLTSVFAFAGKERAKKLLRRLSLKGQKEQEKPSFLSMAGFQKKPLCHFDHQSRLTQTLNTVIHHPEIDDKKILKISQDYVREVVAHEVGHTLGLRHNFAGSLATNIPLSTRKHIFEQYMKTGDTPTGIIPSSSVMEYQRFEEGSITGDIIAKHPEALEYDQKAIAKLYDQRHFTDEELPFFCTDSDTRKYADCKRFDTGHSIVETLAWTEKRNIEELPYALLDRYALRKSPATNSRPSSVAPSGIDAKDYAAGILNHRTKLLKLLTPNFSLLKVRQSFADIIFLNSEDIHAREVADIESEVAHRGGIEALLAPIDMARVKKAKERFFELLADEAYTRTVEEDGTTYDYSHRERQIITAEVEDFFRKLPEALREEEVRILSQAMSIEDHALGRELEEFMTERAREIILSTKDNGDESSDREDETVIKIGFEFPYELRMQATKLLRPRTQNMMWGYKKRRKLKSELHQKLNQALKTEIMKIKIENLSTDLGRWVLENKRLLMLL